ncbi:NosD domain-containing protein [Methanotrichaceae archaeon M04Ac]|jgi:parallel beta-helix repeat protein|uniref:NosD domain-containing protein n=1 Tax=Candidatus Methanocrinis alkalitolerans TaxID=3033395 RepID=A0ABT5XDN0_9EURY|nr:NosD domain-containing protein [Candidatus Methanocrinis alkalitolerans]MCR3884323.1 right-handed parallel beta-helix repeat-containing protein [Methanothrix sp.]MDF0592765.1 NosD domain-containing protein [Candidatus Methanocrinis alkalitolerans]
MVEKRGKADMICRLLPALILTAAISIAGALAATVTVGGEGCDYASVQKAVEEANPGDTITVLSGTYKGNVLVDKSIVIRGRDTGSGKPVIEGTGAGSTMTVSADRVTLEGLVVKNGGFGKAGIEVISNKNFIRNNVISDNRWYGIYLSNSGENVISGNSVTKNKYGIWIPAGSDGNRISENDLSKNANANAVDAGVNRWEKNGYDDLGEAETSYRISGGSNVDPAPRAVRPEPAEETKTSTITVKITIPRPIIGS